MRRRGGGGSRPMLQVDPWMCQRAGGVVCMRALWISYPMMVMAQVEVKIRLPDRAAYDKVAEALKGGHTASHAQVRAPRYPCV